MKETGRKTGHGPFTGKNGTGQRVVPVAPHKVERNKILPSAERAKR